jgi:hypothetical protein
MGVSVQKLPSAATRGPMGMATEERRNQEEKMGSDLDGCSPKGVPFWREKC